MSAVVIQADSSNIKLISELARKLGGKVSTINEDQLEDIAFGEMLEKSKTGTIVSRESIMNQLK